MASEVGEDHIGNGECKSVVSKEISGVGLTLENQPVSAETVICDKKSQPVLEHGNKDRSWANVVGQGRASKQILEPLRLNQKSLSGNRLEFFAPKVPGVIDIEDDWIDEKRWGNCLVGNFLDANLGYGLVKTTGMADECSF
ncbi:hypothetical protein U1Q18_040692 [Sarracenia purpurea var. burkii]